MYGTNGSVVENHVVTVTEAVSMHSVASEKSILEVHDFVLRELRHVQRGKGKFGD